jgi:hypothetical protein
MPMKLTAAAAQHLAQGLTQATETAEGGFCFRIIPSDTGGLKLTMAQPGPKDERFEVEGNMVLAVAPEIAQQVEGHTLDVQKLPDGSQRLMLLEGRPPDGGNAR